MNISDEGANLIKINDYISYFRNKNLSWYKGFMDVDYSFHITDLFDNFFNDPDNIQEFQIDSYDKMDFQYNPKGLSFYLYGTPDLWPIILRTNNWDHPGEMELESGRIKIPKAENLDAYMSMVYSIKDTYFQRLGHKW